MSLLRLMVAAVTDCGSVLPLSSEIFVIKLHLCRVKLWWCPTYGGANGCDGETLLVRRDGLILGQRTWTFDCERPVFRECSRVEMAKCAGESDESSVSFSRQPNQVFHPSIIIEVAKARHYRIDTADKVITMSTLMPRKITILERVSKLSGSYLFICYITTSSIH